MKSANKIHMIKIFGIETLEETHPVFEEIGCVIDEEDFAFIGVSDDDDIFLRLLDYKVQKVVDVLENHFIIEVTDVTKSVISGEAQKSYPEIDFLNIDFLKCFRLENTSKDDVLDKICSLGIDCLDYLDKIILNN